MKIGIILGSTRPGRLGERVAKWVLSSTEAIDGLEPELIDLADYKLPFTDDEISPRYNPKRQQTGDVQKWLDKVAEFDGYVFVTPEYNRSFPAVLKNAVDYIAYEAAKRPGAIVSYSGGPTGGLAAQEALRPVINMLEIIPTPSVTAVGFASTVLSEDGTLSDEAQASPYAALEAALNELKWYAEALAVARAKTS